MIDSSPWRLPKGVWLVACTELWERFSYWGLIAILVLFLTADLAHGGLGWSHTAAIKLYGFYAGAAFAGPLLGAWIANNFWGERRCILVGGILLVAGHLSLSGPASVPWIVTRSAAEFSTVDFRALWAESQVALCQLTLSAEELYRIEVAAAHQQVPAWIAIWVYRLITLSFFGGLSLIVSGTALLKPTISSIVSHFFSAGDQRRDVAFGMFFAAIYVGCILGTFIVGFLAERVGWHWGFSAAALGMCISLAAYLWKQDEYLGDIGMAPAATRNVAVSVPLTRVERDRVAVILWQGCFSALYATAFFQSGGLLLLFIDDRVDRQLGAWTIPSTWLLNVATIAFVVLTPAAIRCWQWLERRERNPSAPLKLAWGLLVIGAAYLLLASLATASDTTAAGKISWVWMALVYLCFGIADLLVWPNQISLASRLAPPTRAAMFIGGWYVTIGVGTWLTGYVGALSDELGLPALFLLMATVLLLLGVLAWRLTPYLLSRTHGLER